MGLIKKCKDLFGKKKQDKTAGDLADISELREMTAQENLSDSLSQNLVLIKEYTGNSFGLNIREFNFGPKDTRGAIVFMEGMVNTASQEEAIRSLLVYSLKKPGVPKDGGSLFAFVRDNILLIPEIKEGGNLDELLNMVMLGDTLFLMEGVDRALALDTKGWKTRNLTEPEAETSIRGAREGFNESIHDNLSLLRRRLPIAQLWVESFQVGSLTRTHVTLIYIKGLVGEGILAEIRSRLKKIDTDSIIESGDIEQFIEDEPFTIFPLIQRTERPDKVVASLVEGQAAIMTNGSPFVLLAPSTAFAMMQSSDDYFEKTPLGTFIRILRLTAVAIAVFLPCFYVSVVNFHQELVPTALILRIAASREGLPFPVILELLLMESVFEILREAGLRLPTTVGNAVSIVGALVLGDAAIRAGIVSPPVVIIVALTAIASFVIPNFALGISIRLLRFAFTALGAVFGLFGVQFGILLLLVHLSALRSFGVPYLMPLAPLIWKDMKDNLFVAWKWGMINRPRLLGFREPVRQDPKQRKRFFRVMEAEREDEEGDED